MKKQLKPSGADVRLDNIQIRSPGLAGEVDTLLPKTIAGRLRSSHEEDNSREFDAAFEKAGIEWQKTLVISRAQEIRKETQGLRLPTSVEPAIEIEVPAPKEGWGQFVLTFDEAGVATWSFAVAEKEEAPVLRKAATRTYRIPRHVPLPPEAEGAKTRGIALAVGKKLIEILVFPLVDHVIGRLGEAYASEWEVHNRPYHLRTFSAEDYHDPEGRTIDAQAWTDLGKGRALLLVHGTFSRANTAFSGLSKKTMDTLWQCYGGRIFAFDHPTISKTPQENVEYLLRQIPDCAKLDLDIVCHSRGGLVSRLLTEKQSELSLGNRQISVRRIVLVGVPNAGTILTDSQYLGEFLNSYTNLLNFFPDNGVTEILEGIITVAKMLAIDALKGLPGLQAMLPTGIFLKTLNEGSPSSSCSYYALASNFEPKDPGFKEWAENHLMDRIFQGVPNDLVVPTQGVYEVENSKKFPIAERYVFPSEKGIPHTGFFSAPETQDYLLKWLK